MDPDVVKVVQQLAHYLRGNPHASDTPDGIARWWLQGAPVAPEVLAQALKVLMERGVLECWSAADGRMRCRRAEPAALAEQEIDRLISGDGGVH